jgi:choline transport protein
MKVDRHWSIPLYAIGLTAFINALLALINIGSSVAFNALVSLVVAGLFSSYIITISLMMRKRWTGEPIPFGPWNMGRAGWLVNSLALLYTLIVTVFSFFPPVTPVTGVSMNWSCAVYGGTVLSGLSFWAVRGRHQWKGPLMDKRFVEQA